MFINNTFLRAFLRKDNSFEDDTPTQLFSDKFTIAKVIQLVLQY